MIKIMTSYKWENMEDVKVKDIQKKISVRYIGGGLYADTNNNKLQLVGTINTLTGEFTAWGYLEVTE